jgi:hypothetical protein
MSPEIPVRPRARRRHDRAARSARLWQAREAGAIDSADQLSILFDHARTKISQVERRRDPGEAAMLEVKVLARLREVIAEADRMLQAPAPRQEAVR